MKSFEVTDIEHINQLMTGAMLNRGFIHFNDECLKLDLHMYFESKPVSIELQENGYSAIKVKLKIYHMNKDVFIPYFYKAIINDSDLIERHSFSEEYSLVLKTVRKLIIESGIHDYIKQILN